MTCSKGRKLLCPESLPDASRKNLRNVLWAIRKTLGEDVLWYPDNDHRGLPEAVESERAGLQQWAARLEKKLRRR